MGDAVEPRKNWIEENVIFSLEDDYKTTLKCDVLLAELYRKQYKDIVVKWYHCPPI